MPLVNQDRNGGYSSEAHQAQRIGWLFNAGIVGSGQIAQGGVWEWM